MSTPILNVCALDSDTLDRAAAILRGGGLVAFPTETVYGLGANALDPSAVEAIFTAKGRPANNPVIVHLAKESEVLRVVSAWPEMAVQLAKRFWPGPLTLVLPKGRLVPSVVTAGGPTVAVRIPAHPVALALIERAGVPIAAPSANRSNRLSPTMAEHVLADLDNRIDLILDAGPTSGGIESTVLDLSHQPPRLLRPGLIDPVALEEVIGPILRPALALGVTPEANPSPGLLPRHYAPRTPMECVAGGLERVRQLTRTGARVAWLVWFHSEVPEGVRVVRLPGDAAGYAAELYRTLHTLDELGLDRIVTALPPDGEEWLGVRDRLRRAAE